VSRWLVTVLVVSGAAVSACGGGDGHAAASSGRALFDQACGACHTLTGHNDPRHQGGDLRDFHAGRAQLEQLAAEMPVRRPLSRGQLATVVRFVMAVETAH
jgi:mono/diheme cytochrome c family protein